MPKVNEPRWVSIEVLGSEWEREADLNADPSAPDEIQYRYRPVQYSGEHEGRWLPGLPPMREKADWSAFNQEFETAIKANRSADASLWKMVAVAGVIFAALIVVLV